MNSRIFLIGPMGSGKTTVGRKLAQLLKYHFLDTDQMLVERTGVSIAHIFEIEGEEGFRDRETKLLEEVCELNDAVISTGGGIVLRETNRRLLSDSGTVVYLSANQNVLWNRLRNCTNRPLLQTDDPQKVIADLLEARSPLYAEVATIKYEVSSDSAYKTAKAIFNSLKS